MCFTTQLPSCGSVAPVIDHNTYDGKGVWVWRDATVIGTLAAWKRASGAVEDDKAHPGFTNPAAASRDPANFDLTAASSCVDSGETLLAVTKDFTGLSRPQGAAHDRGAFELRLRR
jgi:hypothetical protein